MASCVAFSCSCKEVTCPSSVARAAVKGAMSGTVGCGMLVRRVNVTPPSEGASGADGADGLDVIAGAGVGAALLASGLEVELLCTGAGVGAGGSGVEGGGVTLSDCSDAGASDADGEGGFAD